MKWYHTKYWLYRQLLNFPKQQADELAMLDWRQFIHALEQNTEGAMLKAVAIIIMIVGILTTTTILVIIFIVIINEVWHRIYGRNLF